MNLLAVDTTGDALGLALRAGERVLSSRRRSRRPHDETLIPAVEALLAKAGLSWDRLDGIAAASGPGRFTGIRIGMAFAAVAAGRLGKPALAVSRLEAAAWAAGRGSFVVMLPAFRDERYYQLFRAGPAGPKPAAPPVWASAAAWAEAERGFQTEGLRVLAADPGPELLLAAAARRLSRVRRGRFEPLYLKPAGYERTVR